MARKRRRLRFGRIFLAALFVTAVIIGIRALGDKRIRVALDAGHGGWDPGASGFITETDLTQATVRELQKLLAHDERFRVILCRDLTEGKELNDRWKKANSERADLLLSVHGNSADDPTANGFEAYPAPPGRKHHKESLRFAKLLANRAEETGIALRGDDGIRYAYYVDSGNGDTSKVLENPSQSKVPVETPSFAMVDYPNCPAVLVEQCFLTNEGDLALLGSEEGCKKAALQYYRAICDYFGIEPMQEGK